MSGKVNALLRNPALLLACGLPAAAVVASVMTSLVAMQSADVQLPEQYHWEGFQLDRDFTRAERARDLAVEAHLSGFGASGSCELVLRMKGEPSNVLTLAVTHATLPQLDQRVAFERVATAGGASDGTLYRGACRQADEGHWRLELADAVNGWAVRQSVRGSLTDASLSTVAQ